MTVMGVSVLLFFQFRCSKSAPDQNLNDAKSETSPSEAAKAPPQFIDLKTITVVPSSLRSTCGGGGSGTYPANSGYYTYPYVSIDATCMATTGGTLTLIGDAVEIPDRFTLYDANGNFVATTGWIGAATYPGPWVSGPPVNGYYLNLPNLKIVTIPNMYPGIYTLKVETSTGPQADSWNASVSCSCATPPPDTCSTCLPCVCTAGLAGGSGTYAGNGYYTYPEKPFSLKCVTDPNKLITLLCDAVEVPDRFTIRDANNNFVVSSGWIGSATYPGPWVTGPPKNGYYLNVPNFKIVTFKKVQGVDNYKLVVETSTGPQNDSWNASINCNN
jgi:hypothetical protein